MGNTFRLALAASIVLVLSMANAKAQTWEPPYRGDDPKLLYLPDAHVTYWRYGWNRKPGDKTGVIIKGTMPDARYFSYNVYNDETKSTLGSFTDYQLKTDDGSPNPFGGKGGNPQAKYAITVLPEGTRTDKRNVLYFPDSLTKVSVFLRHYVANGTIEGNVPLPEISTFDPARNASGPAQASTKVPALSKQEARQYLVPMLERLITEFEEDPEQLVAKIQSNRTGKPLDMKELIASQVVAKSFKLFRPGDKLYSLRLQTAGTYPNQDNYYLGLPVIRQQGQALLARFKAPTMPQSPGDYPSANVRYYSLSQGDEFSYTHGTAKDADMKLDGDGFANFIIADDSNEMRKKAADLGANFMPWQAGDKMLLIYRHMLPNSDFAQGIDKVTSYDPAKPAADQLAIKKIGASALAGKLVDSKAVLEFATFPQF